MNIPANGKSNIKIIHNKSFIILLLFLTMLDTIRKDIIVDVPTFRATKDVSQKADIIEEIARIHKYNNIKPKTNLWAITPVQKNPIKELEYSTKELLASKYGMSEVHSYVWYNTEMNQELGIKVK